MIFTFKILLVMCVILLTTVATNIMALNVLPDKSQLFTEKQIAEINKLAGGQ